MSTPLESVVREQLAERHEKLEAAITVAYQLSWSHQKREDDSRWQASESDDKD